jgi:hypothetical protein
LVTGNTVHEIDQTSEQAAKGTSGSRGREEEGNAEVDLVAAVPLS